MSQNEYKHESKGHSPIQKHLEEQFGQMRRPESAPEELKDQVFDTLDTLNLVADIVDLFTVKFSKTEAEFLDLFQEDSAKEEEEQGI